MNELKTVSAAGRRRVRRTVIGAGLAGALVLSTATIASAADAPTPSPSISASTAAPTATPSTTPTASPSASPTATPTATPTPTAAAPTPTPTATVPAITSVVTIKGRTAGTGTNFSGTYKVQKGSALVPADGRVVALQRKTPAGWDTVQTDAADVNGNLVYGTVQSNYVQTWRLVAGTGTADPDYGVSPEFKVAQNGKAATALKVSAAGSRTGKHVAFKGYFRYRSWWITSGPNEGEQGFVAPLNTRVYLQYLSGRTWKNKTSVLTEDRLDAGVNVYIDVTTTTSKARVWRLHYAGSSARAAAVSKAVTR